MKVGAVDADKHQSLGGQYGVRGFPTIKIFGANKNKAEDYQGKCDTLSCAACLLASLNIVMMLAVSAGLCGISSMSGAMVMERDRGVRFVWPAVHVLSPLLS